MVVRDGEEQETLLGTQLELLEVGYSGRILEPVRPTAPGNAGARTHRTIVAVGTVPLKIQKQA